MPKPQLPITAVVTPQCGRGRHGAVPGDLRVVVGVQVHDAGHQGQALGFDAVAGWAVHLADVGDAALRDGHIGLS
jgi:hypothetical protein